MKLTVRFFAGLAESAGLTELKWESGDSRISAGMLKENLAERYPSAAAAIRQSFVARNRTYAGDGEMLEEGDEIALIPPVSGGQDVNIPSLWEENDSTESRQNRFHITGKPLSADAVTRLVAHPDHGAVLSFTGTTRGSTGGVRTLRLEYEAYQPMAGEMLARIGDEIGMRWPGTLCAIAHRVGVVEVGEASVIIAVSAPHRNVAYEASRYAIERLKQVVPIWKKEIGENESGWVQPFSAWNPTLSPAQPAESGDAADE